MRASSEILKRARGLRKEVLLWRQLRRSQAAGNRFRRQHPIGPFILDFYCAAARLAVEIDGQGHDLPEQAIRDLRRADWLHEQGIRTLRFPAKDILSREGLENALATIMAACAPSTAVPAVPLPRFMGEDQQ